MLPDDKSYRDTRADVNLDAIAGNLRKIRRHLPATTKLMAIVKGNGYGHGDIRTASAAVAAGADALGVAFLEEGVELRRQGITLPILVLTPVNPGAVTVAMKHDLMLTVTSAAWFEQARRQGIRKGRAKLKVHVKMDTGLGRIGIRSKNEWDELVPHLKQQDIVVDGVYTHFATAAKADTTFLFQQYKQFLERKSWVLEAGVRTNGFHCANSAAALRFPELAMDMVRIGAAMYGFYPRHLVPSLKLEPALSLRSRLIQVKRLAAGEAIGYDNDYRASGTEWIGTIPVGYADGWSQCLRSAEVLVGGERAPIVGKIGMDQLMLRLPRSFPEGTEVTLIGAQGREAITCEELAAHLGSVPQEITSSLTSRVPRDYSQSSYSEAMNVL